VIGRAPAGARIEVVLRRLKGVALLRIEAAYDDATGGAFGAEAVALVGALADKLGGTALAERLPDRQRVSVRLALAPSGMACAASGGDAGSI
jgi:hypothetical protein